MTKLFSAMLVTALPFLLGCAAGANGDATAAETVVIEPAESSKANELDVAVAVAAVEALLDAQVSAWNRGDIPGFMEGYWKDPALRFASGNEVQRGWQPTLEGYLERYPDRAAMGALRFEEREVTVLSDEHALVFGRWILDRAEDQPQGLFTLLLRRVPSVDATPPTTDHYAPAQGWRVVADHTSSAS